MENSRIKSLDGLKGLAIMGVILIHSGNNVPRDLSAIPEAIISCGKRGVQVFFIISAILIYNSLSNFYNTKSGEKYCILTWYKKRFVRLIPLYWLTNTAILIRMGMTPTYASGTHGVTVFTWITNYLFLHGFYPWHINAVSANWYVGTLAIFIFIAPMCFKAINNIWKAILLFISSLILESIIGQTIATWDFGADTYVWVEYWEGFSIFKQLPVLSIGIIVYFVLFKHKAHLLLKKFFICKLGKRGAKVLFYASLIFLWFLIALEVVLYVNMYVFSITITLIIVLLFCFPTRIISNKIYSSIGKYSYGIYLFHPLILGRINVFISRYTENALFNILLSAFIALVICLVGSVILTNFFEKPTIKWFMEKNT